MKDDLKPWVITLFATTVVAMLLMSLVLGLVIAYQAGLSDSQARLRHLETQFDWLRAALWQDKFPDVEEELLRKLQQEVCDAR